MPRKLRVMLTALLLLAVSLACEALTGRYNNQYDQKVNQSEWEEMRAEEEFLADQGEAGPAGTLHSPVELSLPSECNAQDSLHVAVSQPVTNDDQNEYRCKYTVTYANTGDQLIWVYVHKTYKDPNSKIEEVWKNYYALDPGESLEMRYQSLTYKESGDTWIEIVTDVAPIFATEGCKNTFLEDVEPRRQISYPIYVPCD